MDFTFPSFCYAQAYVAFTRAQDSNQCLCVIPSHCLITVMTMQSLVTRIPSQDSDTFEPEVESVPSTYFESLNIFQNSTFDWDACDTHAHEDT